MYPQSERLSQSWQLQARSLLRRYLAPHRHRVALLGLLVAGSAALQLLGPQILQWAIDATTRGTTVAYLSRLGILYMLATVATRAAQGATTYVTADLGWRATNRLRADLAHRCLSLPLQFHAGFTPGQLVERIDGDVGVLSDLLSQFLLRLLANALFLLGMIAVLSARDWRIGLTFLLSLLATLAVYRRLANVAVPAAAAERQAQAELLGVIEENLSGAEDARPLGAAPYLLRRLHGAARRQVLASRLAWPLSAVPLSATMLVLGLNEAVSLVLGVRLVEGGVLTVGAVYLIVQYSSLISGPLHDLARQMGKLQMAGASVARVTDLLERRPEGADDVAAGSLPPGPLGVRFEGVDLAYPGGPPVLEKLCFALEPGEVLGVAGRTGGGKSSLARLLLRLYEPTGGAVLVGSGDDWRDVRRVPLPELRRRVSLVTQEVQLFAASVRHNLTLFGALDAGDERLAWALREVGLGEWLRSLPRGLDTPLLGGETGLSAGQAQLLALARVFLRDPGLVLLDEASSRLDPSSQAMLERAVDRLLEGRTAIVIAHRPSALRRAGRVLVLEDGVRA